MSITFEKDLTYDTKNYRNIFELEIYVTSNEVINNSVKPMTNKVQKVSIFFTCFPYVCYYKRRLQVYVRVQWKDLNIKNPIYHTEYKS